MTIQTFHFISFTTIHKMPHTPQLCALNIESEFGFQTSSYVTNPIHRSTLENEIFSEHRKTFPHQQMNVKSAFQCQSLHREAQTFNFRTRSTFLSRERLETENILKQLSLSY